MQLSGAAAGRLLALTLALCMGTAIRSAHIAHTSRFTLATEYGGEVRVLLLVLGHPPEHADTQQRAATVGR